MNLNMGILGRKIGMTQIYDDAGRSLPVTAIEAGPCTVLQVKTQERDGYSAIQLGFADKPVRNVPEDAMKRAQGRVAEYDLTYARTTRPMRRHFLKADTAPKYFVREIRLSEADASGYEAGQEVRCDVFEKGQFVDVIGTSKGRGFTGVVKRHNFAMFPRTHGTHEWRRHGGSIGCRQPQRTRKGQRMAGQHGNARVTVQNLLLADTLPDQNVLLIRGAIPGPKGGFVIVRTALKK